MLNQGSDAITHMAFIMDGNRRWARSKGLSLEEGYRKGAEQLQAVVAWGIEHKISHMSFFAFGKENWNRPAFEVDLLWRTLVAQTSEIKKYLIKEEVSFSAIGDENHWPSDAREALKNLERATADFKRAHVGLVLDYSGSWDISQATLAYATSVAEDIENIKKPWTSFLKSSIFPDPQILVRTGGEQRLSNFYLYNIAYAELFFLQPYWPDFAKEDFESVLQLYEKRHRRFGK